MSASLPFVTRCRGRKHGQADLPFLILLQQHGPGQALHGRIVCVEIFGQQVTPMLPGEKMNCRFVLTPMPLPTQDRWSPEPSPRNAGIHRYRLGVVAAVTYRLPRELRNRICCDYPIFWCCSSMSLAVGARQRHGGDPSFSMRRPLRWSKKPTDPLPNNKAEFRHGQ